MKLNIGDRFKYGHSIWTVGGYTFFQGHLWYCCVDEDGKEDDIWSGDADYVGRRVA